MLHRVSTKLDNNCVVPTYMDIFELDRHPFQSRIQLFQTIGIISKQTKPEEKESPQLRSTQNEASL